MVNEILKALGKQANPSGLPVFSASEWEEFKEQYEKKEAIEALAHYIVSNNIPFPFQEITENDVVDKFKKLKGMDHNKLLYGYTTDITDKFNDYKYSVQKYCKDVIDINHYYNDISNYFQQQNRLKCSGWAHKSPLDIWSSEEALKTLNWTFWRDGVVKFVDESKYREAFRLGAYVATQFKPTVAKYVYNRFNAKTVLDTSCGWGDRLAGFWASNAETYVGCDPNPNVYKTYMEQCKFYDKHIFNNEGLLMEFTACNGLQWFRYEGSKTVTIFNAPAEDIKDFPELSYDLAFTSPPYYNTERYAEGIKEETQSWFKYKEFDSWLRDFLFVTLEKTKNLINPQTGVIAVNIIDANIKNRRHYVCDPMTDFMAGIGMPLQEVIGMRMKQRPKNEEGGDKEHMQDCFVEPIWVYSSSNENTLTQFERLFE